MKIAQLTLDDAPLYERKCQRIDAETLASEHQVVPWPASDASIVHVYGPRHLPPRLFRNFPRPYVASGTPARARLSFAKPRFPGASTADLPEAVEPIYRRNAGRSSRDRFAIGVLVAHRRVGPFVDATAHRLARFREDVDWHFFDVPPTPDDFTRLDLWLDPAIDDEDRDGYTAEALASGVHVVATRTRINAQRLDGGRAGFLTPPNDPNELTHAILTALFKPEISQPKLDGAREAAKRFDPAHRRDALVALYREVLR